MTATRFAVIDAETDPFKAGRVPRPFAWGFFDGDTYAQFDTTAAMVEYISEFNGIIYAHNGGKFDFHFLLDYLNAYDDLMIINGRIGRMTIGNAELRDSWLILPIPLGAYEKDEIDYAIFEADQREKFENKQKIRAYLKGDCVYLHRLVSRFLAEYGLSLTQAGSSMKQWKAISPVAPVRTDAVYYARFAPFYFGGRVQCFEKGIIETDFSVYDINSAYPHAMLSEHPYSDNYSTTDQYKADADFYRVLAISRGAFPLRDDNGGLSFPDDNEIREYHVTKWEYAAAIETKTAKVIEVLESITFCGHMHFSDYILKNYNARLDAKKAGDKAGVILYKLAMNSLYGKFAANPENYSNYMVAPMEDMSAVITSGWQFDGQLGDWALCAAPLDEYQQHYYNVATGASITGFVRAKLWRAICASNGVLYCDTDSIAVRAAVVETGDKLGQWKHEGDFVRAGISGKKMYIFAGAKGTENKYASKGVRLTEKDLWRVASGKTVRYEPENPTFSVRKPPSFVGRDVVMTG